jgi:site-specific DNA recombinase
MKMNESTRTPTAAYCRVSTKSDTQDGSYEVQCAYYEKLIEEDPNLELVGIYGDHGKSGRYMRGRTELNRLIKDCEAGKVKLILTKSISRFARNMMECVDTIRHLKEIGVTIRFEKESIDTETMGGELMLGILATIAQEESNSISTNMSWSRRKHLEKGQPWNVPRYGYVSVGKEHRWEIVPSEAEVVRRGFYMAGMCYTYGEIADELNRMEQENGSDRIWTKPTVVNLLRSENYIGDYLANKEVAIIDENGQVKRVKNRGQKEQFLIEEHHEPIVSRELYGVVQELLDHVTLGGHRRKFSEEEHEIMERAMELAAREETLWVN